MSSLKTVLLGLLSILTLVSVSQAFGHDDGLTCHQHPPRESAVLDFALTGDDGFLEDKGGHFLSRSNSTTFAVIVHQFDNMIAERPQDFDPGEVRLLRSALTELEQSVYIVLQLLEKSNRSYVAKRQVQLLKLARRAHAILALADVLPFSEFRSSIRDNKALKLDMTTLKRHLIESTGSPDNLIIVLENAAGSC